jgi:putative membrane protein
MLILHVFGVVMWLGALLVISSLMRLATNEVGVARESLIGAARQLMRFSANIGALVAIIFGVAALLMEPVLLTFGWFHLKLLLVLILLGCHFRLYQRIGAIEKNPSTGTRGEFAMLHGIVSAALLFILALLFLRPF